MWIGYSLHMKAKEQAKKKRKELAAKREGMVGSRRVSEEEKVELLLRKLKITSPIEALEHELGHELGLELGPVGLEEETSFIDRQ